MKLLLEILSYRRPHNTAGEEQFIKNVLLREVPGLNPVGQAEHPNYMIEVGSGSKTLFSCHIDTVHTKGGRQQPYLDTNLDLICAPKGVPLGADNGAGIWVLLGMIAAQVPGVYLFHRGEECGGIGSRWMAANHQEYMRTFERAIAFDRRDNMSVITHQRGSRCCSDIFATALAEALSENHELDPTGSFTDTASYMSIIPECTNVSVGYLHEHTPDEVLDVGYVIWLGERVKTIAWEQLPTSRDPKVVEARTYPTGNYGKYGSGNYGRYFDVEAASYTDCLDWVKDHPEIAASCIHTWCLDEEMNIDDIERLYGPYVGDTIPSAASSATPPSPTPANSINEDHERLYENY